MQLSHDINASGLVSSSLRIHPWATWCGSYWTLMGLLPSEKHPIAGLSVLYDGESGVGVCFSWMTINIKSESKDHTKSHLGFSTGRHPLSGREFTIIWPFAGRPLLRWYFSGNEEFNLSVWIRRIEWIEWGVSQTGICSVDWKLYQTDRRVGLTTVQEQAGKAPSMGILKVHFVNSSGRGE